MIIEESEFTLDVMTVATEFAKGQRDSNKSSGFGFNWEEDLGTGGRLARRRSGSAEGVKGFELRRDKSAPGRARL